MLVDPVVALVFLVGEHGGGGRFVESRGDGEAAGTGADDEDIVEGVGFSGTVTRRRRLCLAVASAHYVGSGVVELG